jgi:hypothetical protein
MYKIDAITHDGPYKAFHFKLDDGKLVTLKLHKSDRQVIMPENTRWFKLDVLIELLEFVKKNI